MHWKGISESVPAGWAEALDQGIDDVDHGRVVSVSSVVRDLDATLAAITTDVDDVDGHGQVIANRAKANRRPQR